MLFALRGKINVLVFAGPGKCREENKTYPRDALGCVEAAKLVKKMAQGESGVSNLLRCACEKGFQLSGKLGDCKKFTL